MTPEDPKDPLQEVGALSLARERREIMSLPPEKALGRILEAPDTGALVRSFAEEDFYFLVNGIGPEDSLPILAAAAPRQWAYLLDLETWNRDRFEPAAAEQWIATLERAAGSRLIRWMLRRKKDLLDLFLSKTATVYVREHDQDPSEFGEDVFTLDDVYYVRVVPPEGPPEGIEKRQEERERLIPRLLEKIAEVDHRLYQHQLLEAAALLPAEAEEEAYRLRNVRLAEKGFAPPDEAVGIYQRLTPGELLQRGRKHLLGEGEPFSALPVPGFADGLLDRGGLFARSLSALQSAPAMLQLQQEFAGLCNRVIAADQAPVREREALRGVVEKAAGYLSIGLERLIAGKKGDPAVRAARLIEAYPLVELFRVGHGEAMALKWKAGKWQKQSWYQAAADLPIHFWDEQWVGVLGGLLLPRPRFFDNYRTGPAAYRDFACLEDIRWTEAVLDQIIATDRVLSLLNLDPAGHRPRGLTYKNVLLTLWAIDTSGLADSEGPFSLVPTISTDALKQFHRRLFADPPPQERSGARRIADTLKEAFARWLSRRTGLDPVQIGRDLGPMLEDLFAELEEEMGAVDARYLDPRYVRLFLVADPDADAD